MMQAINGGKHTLGECVLWCERTARLWWTDIAASTLWCHTLATQATQSYAMPERLACFALTGDDNRLLLGLASGLAFYQLDSGELQRICEVEANVPGTRLNDGRCDRQGRFVFGMFNQNDNPRAAIGGFYRLHQNLHLERLPLPPAAIANSICFSPDGGTMYFCDSQEKVIYQCDYGDSLGVPRLFADLRASGGEPDGSTIDSEGFLWNAVWGAAQLIRFAPDGTIERRLELAAPHPTCIAFGGTDLKTLYASSATQGMDPAALVAFPEAGRVFEARVEIAGLPETRFFV